MAHKHTRGLRFTRLKIAAWKNFKNAELELQTRAFFIGPNASGKSNLLDVFRFLGEIASQGSGGLQAAIRLRRGFTSLRSLHQQGRNLDVEIEAHVGTDAAPDEWIYKLSINRRGARRLPVVTREIIEHGPDRTITRKIEDDDEVMSQTLMEQATTNAEFRPLVEFFRSSRYLHIVPQIVRDRRRAIDKGDDPFGGDLLRRMSEMPQRSQKPRIERVAAALKIAVPQFEDLELFKDDDVAPHLKAKFKHWRGQLANQTEDSFSDGTLRLIGLLWSIAEGGGPLLLEEPELSLNDAIVAEIPTIFREMQKISRRQVIATTHAAALLDAGLGLNEVHLITVDQNGSSVRWLADDLQIAAQVRDGFTIAEAVLPILRPQEIARFGRASASAA